MNRRFDVFVSHSSEDKPWVLRLVADLARYGVSVWLDENEIRPGTHTVDALERGIDASRAMVLVVSPESMASGWVKEEYSRAMTLAQRPGPEFPIIAAILREAEQPGFLKNRTQVDFRDDRRYTDSVWRLAWGIKGEKPPHVLDLDANALPPLPGDHVPEPAPLPPRSRMHMRRNPQFVGRMEQLRALARALQVQGRAAIGQVASVTGLGGIGKTQLAVEFVYSYGQFFHGGVFWLSFADHTSVDAEFAQCGGPDHLGLWTDENAPADIATQADRVRNVFAGPEPRLLVFDNCEDEALLKELLPASGGCRALVTSRRAAFSPHLVEHTVPIDVLPRPDSLSLLRSLIRGQVPDAADEVTLDAICAELGDLPLALHLAGSFLARYGTVVTPVTYLTQLRSPALLDHPSLQGRGTENSPTDHDLHVGRTFALSWDRLDPADAVDAMARALLQRAACLAPGEPIPHALLVATLGLLEGNLDATLAQADALRRLLELGLLDAPEPETYRIHRLVTAFAQRTDGNHAAARVAVEEALLDGVSRVNNSGYPARLLPWQPHLRVVTDTARAREDELTAGLCHELGYHLRVIGDYFAARPYCEHALHIREKQLGPDDIGTVPSLDNLAALLREQGALAEARPLLERALARGDRPGRLPAPRQHGGHGVPRSPLLQRAPRHGVRRSPRRRRAAQRGAIGSREWRRSHHRAAMGPAHCGEPLASLQIGSGRWPRGRCTRVRARSGLRGAACSGAAASPPPRGPSCSRNKRFPANHATRFPPEQAPPRSCGDPLAPELLPSRCRGDPLAPEQTPPRNPRS